MRIMEAIILAGGLGTRLRTVVSDVPKPMAPIGSRPFLELLLDFWIDEGVRRFILAVGYKQELVVAHFGFSYRGIPIDYSVEIEPKGTGGALFLALEKISNDNLFFVINGDTFFPIDSSSALIFHQNNKSKFTIILKEMPSNERYGTVRLRKDFRIEQFCLSGEGVPPYLINGGVYIANPLFLKEQREKFEEKSPISMESFLFPKWIENGESIFGFQDSGKFIDIGIPEDYKKFQGWFDLSRSNKSLKEGL